MYDSNGGFAPERERERVKQSNLQLTLHVVCLSGSELLETSCGVWIVESGNGTMEWNSTQIQ